MDTKNNRKQDRMDECILKICKKLCGGYTPQINFRK